MAIRPVSASPNITATKPVDLRHIQKAIQIICLVSPHVTDKPVVSIQFNTEKEARNFVQAHENEFEGLICQLSNTLTSVRIFHQKGEKDTDAIRKVLANKFGAPAINMIPIHNL